MGSNNEGGELFHEVSPTLAVTNRIFGALTFLTLAASFVIALVKAQDHDFFYLIGCNFVLSGLVGILLGWWYRRGILPPDKIWIMFVLSAVLIFQAVTSDIYMFQSPNAEQSDIGSVTSVVTRVSIRPNVTTIKPNLTDIAYYNERKYYSGFQDVP